MPNSATIVLIGHIAQPEELKFIPNGTALLRFSLAVNTGYGDKRTCSWYSCTLWGKQAETMVQFLEKGKAVQVVGEPSIREYSTDRGKGKSFDVRVNQITLLGGRDRQDQAPAQESQDQQPALDDNGEIPF